MSDIDGMPTIRYLEELFKLLKENDVASYCCGDLSVEFSSPEHQESLVAAPVFSGNDRGAQLHSTDEIPISGVYSDPRTFGSHRVPPFPVPGEALPPTDD